ncbi:hypothetical protein [Variovorax sp. CY25R-8]|uniref:hypothetical protein n=1 Tax=Variovorax sp. CY25R-8 TaxID=2855501 RepID=UPI0021BBA0BF|nr:hypothetical protein [Variovorax sp. CY25R-8]MCT8176346.1 hypothetical protein [Variovorax sp. CY25R-8]
MFSLRIDPFEFDDPGSEESLEIDVSGRSKFPHPDVKAFVKSTADASQALTLEESVPFYRVEDRWRIAEYLNRFARIDVPPHCDWPAYLLSRELWNETHLVICTPMKFIRYRWSTTA